MNNPKGNKIFIGIALAAFIILMIVFYLAANASREVISRSKKSGNIGENKSESNDTSGEAEKIESLKASNAQAVKEAETASTQKVRAIDSTDHVLGDVKAPVKIITYSDFDCPFCADFNDTLKRLSDEYKGRVVIAYRYLPQRQHANSWPAATAAECAAEQGKFWEMHDKLFSLKKEEALDDGQYGKIAKDLKLNQVKFLECVAKDKYNSRILAQYTEAKQYGVIGTPGTFVNDEIYPGAVPYDDFTDSSGLKRSGMKSVVERMLKTGIK